MCLTRTGPGDPHRRVPCVTQRARGLRQLARSMRKHIRIARSDRSRPQLRARLRYSASHKGKCGTECRDVWAGVPEPNIFLTKTLPSIYSQYCGQSDLALTCQLPISEIAALDDDATIKKHAEWAVAGCRTYPLAYRVPLPTDPAILALKDSDPIAFRKWTAAESERLYRERTRECG